jgi:lipid-A-disaccharide synthase
VTSSDSPLIFVSAGEASGDARAADVIREALKKNPHLRFFGLGGPLMKAEGVELLEDMTQMAHLGFGDVIKNYLHYRRIFYNAINEIKKRKPEFTFLVDSPAFNLRLAKKIYKDFPVLYYVSPQIWAWGKRRIKTIERVITKMLLLFEFEEAVYRDTTLETEVVGHPIIEKVKPSADSATLRKEWGLSSNSKVVALLPGSRKKEIGRILPVMLDSCALLKSNIKGLEFVISEAPNLSTSLFDHALQNSPLKIKRVQGRSYDVVEAADFSLVTSGTATLETALLLKPFFILYRAGFTTYHLAKNLIQIPYIGLINVIAERSIIPEFLQNDARPDTIAHEAGFLLKEEAARSKVIEDLKEAKKKLGKPGAAERAADALLRFLDAN